MSFKDMKDKKISAEEVGSHAECLAAMDCLMHHMSDEDEISYWLWMQDGIPDSDYWRPFENVSSDTEDRRDYYESLVRNMTYDDYETCVRLFANAVQRQCFTTKYTPRAFT